MKQTIDWVDLFFIILIVLMIVGLFLHYLQRCPLCERLGWRKIIGEEDIPGSEYESQQRPSTEAESYYELRIKTRVFHECKNCGHVWEKEGSRRIKKL